MSVPAWKNETPWPSATVDSDSCCMRTRSAIEVPCGSLKASESNSVSLSCAETYRTFSCGSAV